MESGAHRLLLLLLLKFIIIWVGDFLDIVER